MATEQINIGKITPVDEIKPGYLIIVQTPDGTRVIDYTNFVIGQDNITFAPLLSAFDTDINTLSTNVATQNTINVAKFDSVSAETLSLFSAVSAEQATQADSLTALEAEVDTLSDQVTQNTSDIATLSATVGSQQPAININTVDIAAIFASLAQIAALSANWNSVYTQVKINSAGAGWHN